MIHIANLGSHTAQARLPNVKPREDRTALDNTFFFEKPAPAPSPAPWLPGESRPERARSATSKHGGWRKIVDKVHPRTLMFPIDPKNAQYLLTINV